MSLLIVFPENDPHARLVETRDPRAITETLQGVGVRFERWEASVPLAPGAGQDEVLSAYRADVERLKREGGYRSADVVRLAPDPDDPAWPDKARAARQKFLEEHTHAEDEVRFFVEGSGIFYLHLAGKVHAVLCERGDLISVPAATRHWFDMGTRPRFCAIRLFTTPEGWVASFTGDGIARSFPDYDTMVSSLVQP
jgi:1,2-dihydroxy-3-keto-5-methylthiopentene dioxygenase